MGSFQSLDPQERATLYPSGAQLLPSVLFEMQRPYFWDSLVHFDLRTAVGQWQSRRREHFQYNPSAC